MTEPRHRCPYCGRRLLYGARVCALHRDLPALDPMYPPPADPLAAPRPDRTEDEDDEHA